MASSRSRGGAQKAKAPVRRATAATKKRPPARGKASRGDDLLEKRDTFIHTFFKKGAELTEELLREDERLRARLADVETENAELRAQVASDDAIRDLLSKIQDLEKEKRELLSRMRDAQAYSNQFSERFAEIEAENAKLASLYVASFQLHSTLDVRMVVRQIKELLVQFVGARSFAIYLAADDDKSALVPIASEGVPRRELGRVKAGEGSIGRAFATGHAQWVEGNPTEGTMAAPAACVPLRMADRTAGAIAVISTFEQKQSFVELDFELFRLLGAHAASALAAARLFAQHGARIATLDAFVDVD